MSITPSGVSIYSGVSVIPPQVLQGCLISTPGGTTSAPIGIINTPGEETKTLCGKIDIPGARGENKSFLEQTVNYFSGNVFFFLHLGVSIIPLRMLIIPPGV